MATLKVLQNKMRASRPRLSTVTNASKVDVLIAGGGPGGLLAAHALLRVNPDLKIKVLERSQTIRAKGSVMMVGGEAQKVLLNIDPQLGASFRDLQVGLNNMEAYGPDGERLPAPPPRAPPSAPGPSPSAPSTSQAPTSVLTRWFRVQEKIFRCLPEGVVEFGASCTGFEQGAEGVRVRVERSLGGGDMATEEVEAAFLIGCDGINSSVRMALLGYDRDAPFAGDWDGMGLKAPHSLIMRGMIEEEEIPAPADQTDEVMRTLMDVKGVIRTMLGAQIGNGVVLRAEDFFAWVFIVPFSRLESVGLGLVYDGQGKARILDKASGSTFASYKDGVLRVGRELGSSTFGSIWTKVVGMTPERNITQTIYATTKDAVEGKHGEGRVTLLGDSLHSVGPTGVGFSLAAHDCLVLAQTVREHGLTPEALRCYEEARRLPVKAVMSIAEAARDGGDVLKAGSYDVESKMRAAILEQLADIEPLVPVSAVHVNV